MTLRKSKVGQLNAAFISDVHCGHPKVPSKNISDGFMEAFPDTEETGELDVIFIAGDFFDRNLFLSYTDIDDIQLIINRLLRLCEKYDIALRILEGTPSHDWKQSCLFIQIKNLIGCTADVRWIENLYIERIESLNIDVLYVPDEWEHDPNETWRQVLALMAERGIDKVDFCVMHGMFEFQIPKHINITHHDSERYLDITRHYISIGHHHTQRSHKRVLVQGSFDRLCHGEEGAKGHYRVKVNVDGNGKDELIFVENPHATKFVTVDCIDKSLSDSMDLLEEKIGSLPDGSHVRVLARAGSEVASAKRELELLWDKFRWTITREAVEDIQVTAGIPLTEKYRTVNIDSSSVKRLLSPKLEHLPEDKRKRALELLEEVL